MSKLDLASLLKAIKGPDVIKYRLAYIVYPWHKDPKKYTRQVARISKLIASLYSIVPICSHYAMDLLYGSVNEPDPLEGIWDRLPQKTFHEHLQVGVSDLLLVAKCDVVIIAHKLDYSVSAGMCWEYCLAKLLGKSILYWNDRKKKLVDEYPW